MKRFSSWTSVSLASCIFNTGDQCFLACSWVLHFSLRSDCFGAKLIPAQAPAAATFDMLARKALASGKARGFSLSVQWKGKSYFQGSYGLADADKDVPVSAETRYAIGSVSKQFTAVSVLQLAAQRRLSLDNVLAKYLPTLPNVERITLRMLLNQTSGLHNYPNTTEHDWPRDGAILGGKLLNIMSTDKPDFFLGTRFEYSNTNYFALAAVVVQVSGKSLDEYPSQRIHTHRRRLHPKRHISR